MKETSKSIPRRLHDSRFATRYFLGEGIDIGAGNDPISLYAEQFPGMRSLRIWDVGDGDAQKMAGVADESFNFVHSSHCLEHLVDPLDGLRNWFRILKPGGHMVVLVPDEDLYEQGRFPSIRNTDHKNSFTIFKPRSWHGRSVNVTELLGQIGDAAQIIRIELLDATYRYGLPAFDQTLTPIGECAIEFVVRKRPADEVARSGRLPPAGELGPAQFTRLTGIPAQRVAPPQGTS